MGSAPPNEMLPLKPDSEDTADPIGDLRRRVDAIEKSHAARLLHVENRVTRMENRLSRLEKPRK